MFSAGALSQIPYSTSVGNIYAAVTGEAVSSASGIDTAGAEVLFGSDIGELVVGLDQAEGRLILSNSVVDFTSVAEDTHTATMTYARSVQEAAKIERIERYIGFGFSTGAFASGSFSGLGDGTSFFGGDTFSANIEVAYSFSEGAQIADFDSANVNFAVSFDASAAVSDLIGAIPEYPGDISEAATGSEVVSAIPEYPGDISESATASTTASTLVELGSLISEVVIGTDTPTSLFIVNASVSDSATQIDRPFTQYITRPVFVDAAQIQDISEARLQWENINTFETSDWVLIDTNK